MSAAVAAETKRQISIARREILAIVEAVYGETPQWGFVRGKLLAALGDRGLEGAVQRVLRENQDGRCNQDPA